LGSVGGSAHVEGREGGKGGGGKGKKVVRQAGALARVSRARKKLRPAGCAARNAWASAVERDKRANWTPCHQSARVQKEKLKTETAPPGRSQRGPEPPGGVGEGKSPSNRSVCCNAHDGCPPKWRRPAEKAASPVIICTGVSLPG
jgi:hypothetical protein